MRDATHREKAMYGEDRSEKILRATAEGTGENVLRCLRDDAEKHMDGKDPMDDMTIVVARFNPLVQAETQPNDRALDS